MIAPPHIKKFNKKMSIKAHSTFIETYPISPLYEHKVYDPWAQQGEGEQTETGEGETQTGEGQTEFVPSADNPVL